MAKVQLANVAVLDNPSPFLNPFQFEVTFECIEELKEGKYLAIFMLHLEINTTLELLSTFSHLNTFEYLHHLC